jgi:hypothetical protein
MKHVPSRGKDLNKMAAPGVCGAFARSPPVVYVKAFVYAYAVVLTPNVVSLEYRLQTHRVSAGRSCRALNCARGSGRKNKHSWRFFNPKSDLSLEASNIDDSSPLVRFFLDPNIRLQNISLLSLRVRRIVDRTFSLLLLSLRPLSRWQQMRGRP